MNDDDPALALLALKDEHRRLDDQIRRLIEQGPVDQLQVARLKKRKLRLKDEIQRMIDNSVPDIIA